jgi:hypothetical protein
VVETYWQGVAEINDLWKISKGKSVLWVDKQEGDMINLIKLHGSIDWYGLADGSIVKLDETKSIFAKQKVTGELMLYPLQQKDLYLYPWFDLFYRFKRDLEKTAIWLVIGYRFNDEFIRNMFIEILEKGRHAMILVDPDSYGVVREHFNKYQDDRIKSVVGKFGNKQTTTDILDKLNHMNQRI